MRDYEKKSTTSTNAIFSCGPVMLSELLLLLPLLRLAWRVRRVKGSPSEGEDIVVGLQRMLRLDIN